jgi:hypothetical protein
MIPLLVSALMWLLVASLLILRRGREERTITYAALTIAVAQTLSIDAVYEALDRLVGGTNILNLVADLALMVGVFFLGRGVAKASNPQPWAVQLALGRSTIAAAVACAIAAFFLIDRGGTTTAFMLDLGEQPAAAAYSTIQFLYYGSVLTAMAVLAARQLRTSRGIQFLPPASLLFGSILGVMLTATVITMNVAHIAHNFELLTAISVAYGPLYLLTFLLLCLGFAGQPAARTWQARSRGRRTRMLVRQLEPIWAEATRVRPGISQNEDVAFRNDEPETRLHRQVVEIRDAMIDARVAFAVSEHDRELLERAERHLLGLGSTGSANVTSPPSTGERQKQR